MSIFQKMLFSKKKRMRHEFLTKRFYDSMFRICVSNLSKVFGCVQIEFFMNCRFCQVVDFDLTKFNQSFLCINRQISCGCPRWSSKLEIVQLKRFPNGQNFFKLSSLAKKMLAMASKKQDCNTFESHLSHFGN